MVDQVRATPSEPRKVSDVPAATEEFANAEAVVTAPPVPKRRPIGFEPPKPVGVEVPFTKREAA